MNISGIKKNFLRNSVVRSLTIEHMPLSKNIVASKVKAKLSEGVLDITLPKSKPTMI